MDYLVKFITKNWSHHSKSSGYHQIVPLLGRQLDLLDISTIKSTLIPGRIAIWLAHSSGVHHYSYIDFYNEWAAARNMLQYNQPTVYHIIYGDESYRYLGKMRLKKRHKIVASFHQPPNYLQQSINQFDYLNYLDAIIVVSNNQKTFFSCHVASEKIFFVPHGVDTNAFFPSKIEHKKNTKAVLFVGTHKRDFETLRKVCQIVFANKPTIMFHIVTLPENFHYFDNLLNVKLYSGLSEGQLVKLYQTSDLFVQTLKDCTANNAILEALACGLPMVVTDIGGVRDYIKETCADLAPYQDAQTMAEMIISLLENKSRRKMMSLDARQHSLQFDWHIVSKQMKAVYQQLFL